ncbi:MAG: hypothetical protein E7138_08780 [Rikenellaceae bacterium]|nr:hypothetical protein [Rikenellaceae bacterium]
MIRDGALTEWQHLDMPYIYQSIHTLSHKTRHAADHLKILNTAAMRLFGVQSDLTRRELERQTTALLEANYCTRNTSIEVILKLYPTGEQTLEVGEESIYSGYVVRSLRPEASIIRSTAPLADYPTSAMVATRHLMREIATARDKHRVIMANEQGDVINDVAEPLLVIKEDTITLQPSPLQSVEQQLIELAALRLGYKVEHAPITVKMLQSAHEVLILSWQGITAVSHIESKPYMSVISERLALEIESKEK